MPPQQIEAPNSAAPSESNVFWKRIAIGSFLIIILLLGTVFYLLLEQLRAPSQNKADQSIGALNGLQGVSKEPAPQLDNRDFFDPITGVSFTYPATWGRVDTSDEAGECPDGISDPCNQRIYTLPELQSGSIFLTTETKGHEEYPIGRGGFWGDAAGAISASLPTECSSSSNCTLIVNAHGTLIAKRMGVFEMGDDENSASKKIAYYVYSDKGPYYGLILTASRFSKPGDVLEKQFENVLIASLKLTAH